MFRLYTLLKWAYKFKMNEKKNKITADFLLEYYKNDEEKKDLEVGKALLAAENERNQLKIVKTMLYGKKDSGTNDSGEERE